MTSYVQAEFYTPANRGPGDLDYIVIHDMEYPEKSSAAEDCANYFAHPRLPDGRPNRASAHRCVDDNSQVICVLDKDVAFAAPRVNHNGLHIEHAGYAHQTREQWLDGFGLAMLGVSARVAAEWCRLYDIPAVYVDEAGLKRGDRGITTHRATTFAFNIVGGHTDPGDHFPMDVYVQMVRDLLAPPPQEDDMTPAQEAKLDKLAADVRDIKTQLWGDGATKKPARTIREVLGRLADKAKV